MPPDTTCIYCGEPIEERTDCERGEDHHPDCWAECPSCAAEAAREFWDEQRADIARFGHL